jgi:RNA polymerase sigma-70 factor, ECF subfamily
MRSGAAFRPTTRDDDAALVGRARAGERWAEDAIYRRHAPLVTRLCSRLLRHTADTDDVVQDTFLVAFDKLDRLRQPTALRAWLVRIALHGSRRKLRKRKLLALCGLGNQDIDALLLVHTGREHSRPDLALELELIERTISHAPHEQRAAWLLHRVEALSIVETAEAVRRSVATVKRYVSAVDALVERATGGRHG